MKLRSALAATLLPAMAVAMAPPPSLAAAPMAAQRQAPGFYRMHVGRFEVTALLDGTHPFPVDKLAVGAKPGETEKLLAKHYLASPVEGMINAFVVNTGDRLVLVDTGAGDLYGKEAGGLSQALRASGYAPEQIDDIFITHLHEDHVGGLVKDGRMVFPNAAVHVSRRDFDFWTDDKNQAEVDALLKPFFPSVQGVLRPYVEAGRLIPFEDAAQDLIPGLRPVPSPGHTPGHTSYLLHDGKDAMLFWGDTVHVAGVQFDDPHVAIKYDWKVPGAIASRDKLLADAVGNGWWIAAAHISFPGIGHIAASEAHGYAWVPANYTLNR
ncbi:MBL fold metallo-hydrolase [Caulobacter radicis]|uniref:MBL fold metallo-hydrolase n=1 Tax=Caulobacter radicis TaxID=2172650 RepID=UPI000D587717|nr:MBL fold metallo-hydrolase [Caulobacter radicis]PVM88376.1 MBL fold metallo-hydrolase [Caulobacter radicis]